MISAQQAQKIKADVRDLYSTNDTTFLVSIKDLLFADKRMVPPLFQEKFIAETDDTVLHQPEAEKAAE